MDSKITSIIEQQLFQLAITQLPLLGKTMFFKNKLQKSVLASTLALSLLGPSISQACTSLLYTDAQGAPYAGRTLELSMELPYNVTYFPINTDFGLQADQYHPLNFKTKNAFLSIGISNPKNGQPIAIQGLNDKGLTFSLLSYPNASGPEIAATNTQSILAAVDLGAWSLAQFDTVASVKEALEKQPVLITALLPHDQLKSPFHYTLHDASGKSIVIEYSNGAQHIYDNPIGVMTNGPTFPWHMTNLDNYTFFNNKDSSSIQINGRSFQQPDSGIATAGLPASNTSVGRFVRATYYSHFAEKAVNPDKALTTLAHIMNNFDRPRGITIDKSSVFSIAGFEIPQVEGDPGYTSEYTSWTTLTDIAKRQVYIRTYAGMNYIRFDLNELSKTQTLKSIQLATIPTETTEGSQLLLAAK